MPHTASSSAFIHSPQVPAAGLASWQAAQKIATRHQTSYFSSTQHLKSFQDDSNNESESNYNPPTADSMPSTTTSEPNEDFSSTPPPPRAAPNMGASIGAQNVGEMLFNEQLLKSGRGDVRIGSMGRWKDFRGNEIVTSDELN